MEGDRSELLAAMLVAVSATAVDRAVLERVLDEVIASGPWTHATFWVRDDSREVLRSAATRAAGQGQGPDTVQQLVGRHTVSPGIGLVGRAMRAGEISVSVPSADRGAQDPDGAPAAVAKPVLVADRCIGVLEVVAAHRATVAKEQVDAWIEGPLANLSPALGHLLERFRDRAAVHVAEGRLAAALEAGDFGVANVDRRTEIADWSVRMATHHGLPPDQQGGQLGELLAHVHEADRDDVVDSISRASPRPGHGGLETVEYRVVDEDDVRWLSTRVAVTEDPGGNPPVTLISSDVTHRRRLEEMSRRRRQVVEGVQWVWRSLIGSRDLDESARALVNATTGVLGASFGALLYQRPADVGTALHVTWSGDGGGKEVPTEDAEAFIELVDALPSVWRTDLRRSPALRDALGSVGLSDLVGGLRGILVTPVRGESMSLAGAMVVAHTDVDAFAADDVDLLTVIARSAGVAVENARVNEEQRLAAATFQQALLPSHKVDADRVDLCVRYHPGRGGLRVGGDWFDVIDLGDNRLGLAVGDVCGHGVSAAAAMGQFRYSFRALVQTTTPAEAFDVLNETALYDLDTTCTLVYAELDVRTGEARIWSAGHLAPLISRANATAAPSFVDLAGARGPMLGFLDRIRVTPAVVHLAPRDTLLLFSDGLIERRDESIDMGLDRLVRAFPSPTPALDQLCDELHRGLYDAEVMDDDVALLAVRRD